MLVTVTVADVMSAPVVTVPDDATVGEAAERIIREDVGSVIVVGDDGAPAGILTDDDFIGLFMDSGDRTTPVTAVMSSPVVDVAPDATLEDAAVTLRDSGVPQLAVTDDGTIVGVVSEGDLVAYVPTLAHRVVAEHEPSTHRRSTRPDTAWEHDEWSFESFGEGETTVDVGDVVTFEKPLTEADVQAFAEASGDTNRLHLDEAYAERTRFGRRIAHGTLVSGLISAALARLPGLIVYLSQTLTYAGPVDVGASARARCEVVEDLGRERYRLTTDVFVDDEMVVEGEATVLCDPIPDGA